MPPLAVFSLRRKLRVILRITARFSGGMVLAYPAVIFVEGYIQHPGPEDLYDVINERDERGSILLSSNRAPNEWPDLFRDPLLASAGLDRLLDRAEVVIIRGASYRVQGRTRLLEKALITEKQP